MNPGAIIVDDEANLSSYLQAKLATLWPELEILGTAINGRQALALAAETQPDIAFLDIQMPGLSGLQVAQALGTDCQVVFVTAFDHFAVEAFEHAAVDYLLKPVTDARLAATIEKLKLRANTPAADVSELLAQLTQSREQKLQWLRAGLDDTVELVAVDDVVYFKAEQKYTSVFTADAEYLIRTPIKDLELQLDPEAFWRIHRGIIVAVREIASAKRDLRGRYTLSLRSRTEHLRSSQAYGQQFKQM